LRAFLKDLRKRQPVKPEAVALMFDLKGALLKDGSKMNVKARGRLAFPAETLEFNEARWDGDLDLVNVPIALAKDALGLPIKSLTGYLAQRLHIEGNPGTSLRLNGDLEFKQLGVDAPELFFAPIAGIDGRANFEVDWSRQRLQITRADFRANQVKFSLQGDVAAMHSDDPRFRLNFTGLSAPAAALSRYLPLKIVRSSQLEKLLEAIQGGQVEIKKAGIDATLSQLRRPSEVVKQLTIEAEFRDFAGKPPVDGALPFRAGYRPVWTGLGTVAALLLVTAAVTAAARRYLPVPLWRRTHYLTHAAWPVAVVHGLGTGSDRGSPGAVSLTLGCVALVTFATVLRFTGTPGTGWGGVVARVVAVVLPVALGAWMGSTGALR